MIRLILKLGSYIFHPLWLSTYAMVFYFSYSSFLYTYENMLAKIFATIILTVFIPLLFLVLLKPLKIIENFHLSNVKERRIPLLFFTSISAFILNFIFDPINFKIPFYFFSAVFFSGIISVFLSFINYKISLHAVGISCISTFIIGFSLLYQTQTLIFVCASILATGWVISSRLSMCAHDLNELLSGVMLGIVSQIIFFPFWFN
jgi:hypothetical protein